MRCNLVFTVDVEKDFAPFSGSDNGLHYGMPQILSICEDYGIKGTFFCSVDALVNDPKAMALSKEHEIGSHGYAHERFSELSLAQASDAIGKSKAFLEKTYGRTVASFRAPFSDPGQNTNTALLEKGFKVDSSFPCKKYGPRMPYYVSSKDWLTGYSNASSLLEIPVSADPVPESRPNGIIYQHFQGKYLRTHGIEETKKLVKRIVGCQQASGQEDPLLVFMVHSWEFCKNSDEKIKDRNLTVNVGDKTVMMTRELMRFLNDNYHVESHTCSDIYEKHRGDHDVQR